MKHASYHRRKRKQIDLVPLINVIFLLLIFFLVAGTIKKPEAIEITLPESQIGQLTDKGTLVISLSKNREILLNNTKTSYAQLKGALMYKLKENPYQLISVKADAALPGSAVITLMHDITAAGGNNLSITTMSD